MTRLKHRHIALAAGSVTRHSHTAVLVLSAALAGCVSVGPDFKTPVTVAPTEGESWHGGSEELVAPSQGKLLSDDRWSVFNDTELNRLLERSRASNQDIQVAMLRFAQGRIQETTAAAQRGIQVTADGDVNRRRESKFGRSTRLVSVLGGTNPAPILNALSKPYTLYQGGFDASWEPDLWGRVARSMEAAAAKTAEQGAMLRQARLSIESDVARAYFTLRARQRGLAFARQELQSAQSAADVLEMQYRGGMIDDSAVTRQRQRVADLHALLPTLVGEAAQATNQLSVLCGERPGALNAELRPETTTAADIAWPDVRSGLSSELARARPDVAAAEARLHTATATTGIAVADLYPRITLGASFDFDAVGADRFTQWDARQWSVGPSLSLPLFDHGRRVSTIKRRKLEQQEAAVAYQQTVLKAWHNIDDSLSGYTAELQRNAQLKDKVDRSVEEATLAELRRAKGLTSDLPFLDATGALRRAQREVADSDGRLQTALVAVYKSLGEERRDQ